jgi:hypothetical protein
MGKVNGITETPATADAANHAEYDEPPSPRPGLLKRIQTKLNLDLPSSLLMLKSVAFATCVDPR